MKRISVLIDFSKTSLLACSYASEMAKAFDAELSLVHVSAENEDEEDLHKRMREFTAIEKRNLKYRIVTDHGNFMRNIPRLLQQCETDIVMIGTHGQKGIYQNIFGAHILKLIQTIPCSALVVQDHSPSPRGKFNKILYPIGPHKEFHKKSKMTGVIAEKYNSEVELFCIYKSAGVLSEKLSENLEYSEEYFEKHKINYKTTLKDSSLFSVGYAREIIAHAETAESEMIAMMSQHSEENSYLGKVDKTNILLNPNGIPVFCVAQ